MLPSKLFRGDSDPQNLRLLRSTSHLGQFQTNLIKGGVGSLIFTEPLMHLVNTHILAQFAGSHFLSFTENRTSAFRYGLNLMEVDEQEVDACCIEEYDSKAEWDFVLLTIKTEMLKVIRNPFDGIYECTYNPNLNMFARTGEYRLFLIDVATALKRSGQKEYSTAIEYAHYDAEWLVLPATPRLFEAGIVEFSSILDGACFEAPQYFKVAKEQLKNFNTLKY